MLPSVSQPSPSVRRSTNYITPELPKFGPDLSTTIAETSVTSDSNTTNKTRPLPQQINATRPVIPSTRGMLKQTLLDKVFVKKRKITDEVCNPPKPVKIPNQQESSIGLSIVEEPDSATTSIDCNAVSRPKSTSRFPYDVGNFVDSASSLTEQQKYHLLSNVWRPEPTYIFPVNAKGRKFQHQWLKAFAWLTYSEILDGGFCINCLLFGGESTHNASKLQNLFKVPLKASSTSLRKLREHFEKSHVHRTATICATQFKLFMQQKSTSVDVQLDSIRKKQIEENREKLKPIVDAVIVCGRQNIPFRGHRDDSKHQLDSNNNPGNFLEILKYGARCSNVSLDDHLNSTPRNATYKSKTTQNQLIDVCGELLTNNIVAEIQAANFFSILADEATDCANVEQMSLVVRFVDKTSTIREEFLGFVPCKLGLSGEAIANTILGELRQLNLPIHLCRGQGYDGAGNMAGRISGAAARIQATHAKAVYVHCNSHVLNLCVATCCQEQLVRNMMDTVRVVSEFYNFSPKRAGLLIEKITQLLPQVGHKHLIDVCRTRWVARVDGLATFIELFSAIVESWNVESTQKANSLYYSIVTFQFVLSLVIVSRCLEVTRPLTIQLQSISYDAREKVNLLFALLNEMRDHVDKCHDSWFSEAVTLADSVGTAPNKPRTTGRQKNRSNVPAESTSQYYCRSLSIPFLDHLISEVHTRFSKTNVDVLDALYGMPKNVVTRDDWKHEFSKFLETYKDDLPVPYFLETELDIWNKKCKIPQKLPTTLHDVLLFADKSDFPNIYTAFQIFSV